MAVSSIANNSTTEEVKFAEKKGFDTLKTEDFVKILVTQLQNQNPLQPLEDNQLLQQVSGIQSLSSTSQLIETLNKFSQNQSLGAASSLIGREVTALNGKDEIKGVVSKAVVEKGEVFLVIGKDKVPFKNVISVGAGDTKTNADPLVNASEEDLQALLDAAEAASDQQESDASLQQEEVLAN